MSTVWSWLKRVALLGLIGASVVVTPLSAQIPPPGPQEGTSGLTGKVETPAPSTPPTIGQPSNGQNFTKLPITVSGICKDNLLIKIFSNNIFVGSASCDKGSYSLQIDLFEGRNDIVARQFDALDQPSPDSNIVTVNYSNPNLEALNVQQLSLTSTYARKGANPGVSLVWPITISGGTPPFAISVDWGDGRGQSLYSQQFGGTFNIDHVYQSAGVYVVVIKAVDKNGQTAFLQVVGQANGSVTQSTTDSGGPSVITKTVVLWVPAAIAIPLIFLSFWLGRRYELAALRRHLERPDE